MKCPRCGKEAKRLLALSRADNKTMICDECGTKEALDDAGLTEGSSVRKSILACVGRGSTPQPVDWDNIRGIDELLAFMYTKDPEKFSLEIPLPFYQYPLQVQKLETEIPCETRTAGLIIYYPLSMLLAYGI